MGIHEPSGKYEYLKLFNLLISNKDIIGEQEFLSEYINELQHFIKEVIKKRTENVIIYISATLFRRKPVLHHWLKNYLLPQLKNSKVKRIAFISNAAVYPEQEIVIFSQNPMMGVFISKPEAIAWLVSLRPHNLSRLHEYTN